MPRVALFVSTFGLAIVLTGCSLIPSVGQAKPSPVAVSSEDAATAYSDTICAFNEGAQAFADTWGDDSATLRDLQEAASLAKIEAETAREQLESTAWPADLSPDMDVVVAYVEERVAKLDLVLAAEELSELDSIELATTPDAVNESAARIEESLALGQDFCGPSAASAPEAPEGAEDLVGTTWTGTDSDDDETIIDFLEGDVAEVSVGGTAYEGTWSVDDGAVTVIVSIPTETLEYVGNYSPGVTALYLSGTASNGHTFDVLVTNF